MQGTMLDLLASGDKARAAITAPDRDPLSYVALDALASDVAGQLNRLGIGPGDRVAIVLPNGPEMATAFVSIAATATAAPLNPAYRAEEFEFYLSDLKPRALIVMKDDPSPSRAVAAEHKIPVIDLVPDRASGAGSFTLEAGDLPAPKGGRAEQPRPDDIALVLHTSGTTSRPKIVPLSMANLSASARNIGRTISLSEADVCLNIMPLFHIHGLIAAVLSSLAAGASVHCTPGFNAHAFPGWLETARPTWYTAVPTMHQMILGRADRNAEKYAAARLRFIRSSSASLPPQVMQGLESAFGCPVIESYGMTEASHQMTSNPLPPAARKAGSVGRAAGPEVAIMDDTGTLLPGGSIGEVVIRGGNVTQGYASNPAANATAFANGWFRTGDQGRFDGEGYLYLVGRLKEIINRGGEKIGPLEVDNALMDHPAVAQVVTFAVPHDVLGEEVAAAVVLREGATVTERELRDFATTRLAAFKVPRRILFLAEIPKGATGKLQRIGLAKTLGLEGKA
jgi:acyl-CoA synthetase (AMP-forming)/AMP-acid ligase II